MKAAGYFLFIVGLFVASGYAARAVHPKKAKHGEKPHVMTPAQRIEKWGKAAGLPFGIGLVVMIGGGLIARRKDKKAPAKGKGGAAGSAPEGHGAEDAGPMLDGMLARFDELPEGPPEKNAEAMRAVLDKLLEEDVPAFLDRRDDMVSALGLATFAMAIGQFAVMERNAARAWSALTDEAWGEVTPSLERARAGLEQARATVAEATTAAA